MKTNQFEVSATIGFSEVRGDPWDFFSDPERQSSIVNRNVFLMSSLTKHLVPEAGNEEWSCPLDVQACVDSIRIVLQRDEKRIIVLIRYNGEMCNQVEVDLAAGVVIYLTRLQNLDLELVALLVALSMAANLALTKCFTISARGLYFEARNTLVIKRSTQAPKSIKGVRMWGPFPGHEEAFREMLINS